MINRTKKISTFSIMVLIMAGTIGAGIFFKNKTLSQMAQGHFGIVMATWGVGIVAMLAMGLSLIEISSAQKTDKGALEWVKLFCPKWVYHSSSSYIKWIFLPITLFTMPLYVTNALEDAGFPLHGEWSVILFSFIIFLWFMITNLISLKFNEISQWITTAIQLIPLLILPIIAFANSGDVQGTIMHKNIEAKEGLTGLNPWLATIAGISAISFAYDGFYAAASLRSNMKNPQKIGSGLIGGIIGISVVYLFLTIGFNVAGDGAVKGMEQFMSTKIFKMFNVFIAVGIMGVVNSFAMSSPRQLSDLSTSNDAPEILWLQKLLFKTDPKSGFQKHSYLASWIWILGTTSVLFIILGPIAGYAFNLGDSKEYAGGHIYKFCDIITNFTSLLMFLVLVAAIIGALINRKTKKIVVTKNKWFIPAALIAVIIILPSIIYMIIETITGMAGVNKADVQSNVILFVIFIAFAGLSICHGFWKAHKINKQERFLRR